MSQRELARKSGVTNGLISQIEQNRSSPSVASLKRILEAIPMSLSEFFADDYDPVPQIFFRASELREINPSQIFPKVAARGKAISFRQVGDSSRHALQMLHEYYPPGADTGEGLYSHDGEEAGLVVSGRIEVTVGTETEVLGPGDAYIFDSRQPHRFRNPGPEPCIVVSACTPPSF